MHKTPLYQALDNVVLNIGLMEAGDLDQFLRLLVVSENLLNMAQDISAGDRSDTDLWNDMIHKLAQQRDGLLDTDIWHELKQAIGHHFAK